MNFPLHSELRQFLTWWADGLALALPRRWCDPKARINRYLCVRQIDDAVVAELVNARDGKAESRVDLDPEQDPARVHNWLDQLGERAALPVILRIPRERVLVKRLRYPAAAADDLREVIAFEIERQTPFQRSEIYFDAVRAAQAPAKTQITVDLLVIPKRDLAPAMTAVRAFNLELAAIDVEGMSYVDTGVNLLPASESTVSLRPNYALRFALFITWLVLIGFIPARQVHDTQREIARLEQMERRALAAARDVNTLREEYDHLASKRSFLRQLERKHASSLQLLNDLTVTLSDDTWIQRFDLRNGQLTLQGESARATELPNILEASARFSAPRFSSPVTRNNSSGLDRFQLMLTVQAGERT